MFLHVPLCYVCEVQQSINFQIDFISKYTLWKFCCWVALVTMTLICVSIQKLGLLVQTYLHMLDCVNSAIHIPRNWRSLLLLDGEGNGTPLQYSCLENPWMEEPGGLQSMGLLRVGHDWATSLSLFTFMHWKRKWQPTPVFLPGESQGRGSLLGCHLWGPTELDTTEAI